MTSSPPLSTSLIPPPLPLSLITTLLPHLLPPSPLPQELLSKSLLQRLLYLPPSPEDLDSHLSPFPSSDNGTEQPFSSRLQELTHGHRLSEKTLYTKEGDEIYAKLSILPEHYDKNENENASIEIWFEFESSTTSPQESRGWVYHSARIPTTNSIHHFVSTPGELSSINLDAQITTTEFTGNDNDQNNLEAPEGYWTAFDSPPSTNSLSLPLTEHEHDNDASYWAQYSRPATAPITPGIHTPGFQPNIKSPLGLGKTSSNNNDQEEQARKLTESLNQLGLNHLNNDIKNGYSISNHSSEKRGFYIDNDKDNDNDNHVEIIQQNGNDVNDLSENNHGVNQQDEIPTTNTIIEQIQMTKSNDEESSRQVKERLKAKIQLTLNELWRKHIQDCNELDLEIKAMEWLNFGRKIIDHQSPQSSSPNGFSSSSGDQVDQQVIIGKLEILLDMHEIVNKDKQDFFRLLESVIKRQPDYRNEEDFDDVLRQNTYYE
ncbi:uncharacterized protein L201_004589 [Kwoniella dendrophila CBS 6074]|uniref:Uncharacterized protein n=1 Tax=Kwoniella dendrophila CBS 6074 TaxID=1295534 RepID=A0AAX4JXQ9_9TREE